MKKSKDSLHDLWNTIKCTNIRIIEIPEGGGEKGAEHVFKEIIPENLPSLWRDKHPGSWR